MTGRAFRLVAFIAAIAVAGCAQSGHGSQATFLPNNVNSDARSMSVSTMSAVANATARPFVYKVLHQFGGTGDGTVPEAGLLYDNGMLYGTTWTGGASNYGSVFSVDLNGNERVLHSFTGTDGASPWAGLIDVGGVLYGTALDGGTYGHGTVFRITRDGAFKVLYNFGAVPNDGISPSATLVNVHGTLYGTTQGGGAYTECNDENLTCGSVFSITTSGVEHVIYSFGGGPTNPQGFSLDASDPSSGLVELNGTLYGVSIGGGTQGWGTVYSITTGGQEHIVHDFAGFPTDGVGPQGNLTVLNGVLYGTTSQQSASNGYFYSMTTAGVEKLLFQFSNYKADGRQANGDLLLLDGIFYGTTSFGGEHANSVDDGGTAFTMTPDGSETVLHDFAIPGGQWPTGNLTEVNGKLYGVTSFGGPVSSSAPYGDGVVYSLTL